MVLSAAMRKLVIFCQRGHQVAVASTVNSSVLSSCSAIYLGISRYPLNMITDSEPCVGQFRVRCLNSGRLRCAFWLDCRFFCCLSIGRFTSQLTGTYGETTNFFLNVSQTYFYGRPVRLHKIICC